MKVYPWATRSWARSRASPRSRPWRITLGAVALGGQLLGNGGPLGHDDGGRQAQLGGGKGHALAVVARRGGHHPCPLAPLFEQRQAVDGPPQLERPGGLEVLQLQEDLPAAGPAQGMEIDQRGAEDYPGLPLPGGFNVFGWSWCKGSGPSPGMYQGLVSPPRPGHGRERWGRSPGKPPRCGLTGTGWSR